MSEKVRDEFEVECSKLGWDLTRQASANSEYYNHTVVNLCWTFWQASRAALVVELPANCKGMALTVDELRVVLDEIGVTLK